MEVLDFNRRIVAPAAFAAYAKDTLTIDFKKVGDVYNSIARVDEDIAEMKRRFREIEGVLNTEIAAFVRMREEMENAKPWYVRWFTRKQ